MVVPSGRRSVTPTHIIGFSSGRCLTTENMSFLKLKKKSISRDPTIKSNYHLGQLKGYIHLGPKRYLNPNCHGGRRADLPPRFFRGEGVNLTPLSISLVIAPKLFMIGYCTFLSHTRNSVSHSVGRSICWSVCLLVGPSVRQSC